MYCIVGNFVIISHKYSLHTVCALIVHAFCMVTCVLYTSHNIYVCMLHAVELEQPHISVTYMHVCTHLNDVCSTCISVQHTSVCMHVCLYP